VEPAHPIPSWSLARKLGFRCAFLYWLLYALPFPLPYLPWTSWIVEPYESGESALVLWTGPHVLGIEGEIPTAPTGSGDTTFAYVELFCTLALSLSGALLWSLLDRRRASYARLAAWLWTYVRFYLATALITYGAYKVIPSQFPRPALDRLAQPFGEASPMGLLWTFMGASAPYQIFSGAGELLGGLLLFQRRTAVLGAFVATGVMAQVVMLNFAFDTPVKLFSGHLLVMALFLLLPHAWNLFGQFVLGRPAAALGCARLFQRPALHRGALALRTLSLLWFSWQALSTSYGGYRSYAVPPPSPFDGAWHVAAFVTEPEDAPDPGARWTELVVGNSTRLGVTHAAGTYERLQLVLGAEHELSLTRRGDRGWKAEFAYEIPVPERMSWSGTLDGRSVRIDFERRPARDYLLETRGFHWINEVPFNR
jgi:hypothetical protein